MVCPYCSNRTQVVNSRYQKRNNKVWRRRKCLTCRAVFTSLEAVDLASAIRVDKNGVLRPFLADLLFTELVFALSDRKNLYVEARELTDTIIQEMLRSPSSPLFRPSEISQITSAVLKRFDNHAWHRYTAEHPSLTS